MFPLSSRPEQRGCLNTLSSRPQWRDLLQSPYGQRKGFLGKLGMTTGGVPRQARNDSAGLSSRPQWRDPLNSFFKKYMFGTGLISFLPILIILFLIYFFMEKTSTKDKIIILKNFYLYTVSFVALMMIVVSLYSLIDTALKTWVFTQADNYYYEKPIGIDYKMTDGEQVKMTEEELNQEQARIEREQERNRIANLQRDLTRNISMLIVAVPLFTYHWYLVRKKERE